MKEALVDASMAQKNKGPGIQSAAGLIRYFDAEEDTNIKIPPVAVLIFAFAVGIGVILMRIFWEF
jgi:preprotein translocase subunit Sec61beta